MQTYIINLEHPTMLQLFQIFFRTPIFFSKHKIVAIIVIQSETYGAKTVGENYSRKLSFALNLNLGVSNLLQRKQFIHTETFVLTQICPSEHF